MGQIAGPEISVCWDETLERRNPVHQNAEGWEKLDYHLNQTPLSIGSFRRKIAYLSGRHDPHQGISEFGHLGVGPNTHANHRLQRLKRPPDGHAFR
jgi:hypothetical protein